MTHGIESSSNLLYSLLASAVLPGNCMYALASC